MPTTIGSYPTRHGWSAVCALEVDGAHLLVEEHHPHPDAATAATTLVGRYRSGAEVQMAGERRVLARGGLLGAEPEQLVGSPVNGQARAQLALAPRDGTWIELAGRDCQMLEARQAQEMLNGDSERYVLVRLHAQAR